MSTLKKQLMGHARGNADNVSGGELLTEAAPDGSVAFLMGRYSFTVYERAANQKSRGARLNEDDVNLCFMHFRQAVDFAVRQDKVFVGKSLI